MMLQGDCLNRDFTSEARIPGAINLSHAADADLLKDLVRAEARTRR